MKPDGNALARTAAGQLKLAAIGSVTVIHMVIANAPDLINRKRKK
jgi:hypothetical protein